MRKLLIGLVFMFSTQAGFLIEPYMGYQLGSQETTVGSSKYEYALGGQLIGARVGYTLPLLMAGIDVNLGTMDADVDSAPAGTPDTEYDTRQIGLFAGVELPILLRAWATYYFANEYEQPDGDKYSGGGMALGVGFTGLPFVSLNLEYKMLTFDELEDGTTGAKSTLSGTNELDSNEILLSVSLPLDL